MKKILVYQGMPSAGGSKKSLFNLILLLKSDFKIQTIIGSPGWFEESLNSYNIPYHKNYESIEVRSSKLLPKPIRLFKIFIYGIKSLRENYKYIKRVNPDYIFINEPRDYFFVGLPAIGTSAKKISFIRGKPNKNDVIRGLFSWKVVSLSEQLKTELPGFLQEKTTVIPNYIVLDKLQKKIINHKTLNLSFFGSIIPLKQLDHLVEIAKLLKGYDIKFHIVGDIPTERYKNYKAKIMQDIYNNKLEESFLFYGWKKDVKEIMNNVDLILLTSKSEGLPRAILEGMSMGIAAISYDVGGVKDLIYDNENGYVVEIDDFKEMTQKILLFYNDRSKLSAFGQKSREIVSEKFTDEVVLKKYKKTLS